MLGYLSSANPSIIEVVANLPKDRINHVRLLKYPPCAFTDKIHNLITYTAKTS